MIVVWIGNSLCGYWFVFFSFLIPIQVHQNWRCSTSVLDWLAWVTTSGKKERRKIQFKLMVRKEITNQGGLLFITDHMKQGKEREIQFKVVMIEKLLELLSQLKVLWKLLTLRFINSLSVSPLLFPYTSTKMRIFTHVQDILRASAYHLRGKGEKRLKHNDDWATYILMCSREIC